MPKDFQPRYEDFIIVIMGPTGTGKSNFINHLTGDTETRGARNLQSDTQIVIPHIIERADLRIVLVDTPGFDNTYRPDTEILKAIADWLTKKYPGGGPVKVTGLIYLHRITDKRMSGSVYKNLQMFGQLCGNLPLRRARLVTTMWDKEKDQVAAERRENELINGFWKDFLKDGAIPKRFDNRTNSAWKIVQPLLDMGKEGDELLIQEELVEQRKHLNETKAAQVLYSQFEKLVTEQRKVLKDLADQAKKQNDPGLAKILQEEYDKTSGQLQKTSEEMRKLEIPLPRLRRMVMWLFG